MSNSFFARGLSLASRSWIRPSSVSGEGAAQLSEEHALGRGELLALAREARLFAREYVVSAHAVGDFGEVADARGRHDHGLAAGRADLDPGKLARPDFQAVLGEARQQRLVERGNAVVVEARGD